MAVLGYEGGFVARSDGVFCSQFHCGLKSTSVQKNCQCQVMVCQPSWMYRVVKCVIADVKSVEYLSFDAV